MKMIIKRKTIEEILPYGRENALPINQIREMIGAQTVRDTRRQMKIERKNGALILSAGGEKYFLPTKDGRGMQEISIAIKSKRNKARTALEECKPLEAALRSGEYND